MALRTAASSAARESSVVPGPGDGAFVGVFGPVSGVLFGVFPGVAEAAVGGGEGTGDGRSVDIDSANVGGMVAEGGLEPPT